MGTDVSDEDAENILMLTEQVISLSEYRTQLWDYLKNRMQAIAPNLSVMVGELVGARLIAHAGSLMNLAKQPASTVQILGAEKVSLPPHSPRYLSRPVLLDACPSVEAPSSGVAHQPAANSTHAKVFCS